MAAIFDFQYSQTWNNILLVPACFMGLKTCYKFALTMISPPPQPYRLDLLLPDETLKRL